jgi:uncharacterized YigZ family protein
MAQPHQILVTEGQVELLIKKSRFLGMVLACSSEDQAREQLEFVRKTHPKANHHVFAWRLLDEATEQVNHRFHDDGEPGGTAGRPVLVALEANRLINAQVIVVRYFGGIKLGAGGLVRAYGEAAGKAVTAATLKTLITYKQVRIEVPFNQVSIVERWISRDGVTVVERNYDEAARILVELPEKMVMALRDELIEQTAGNATITVQD